MISSFEFTNYKAFQSGAIKLKPLTVLIGANSSGKSSITHLPLLLFQTANREQRHGAAKRRRIFDVNGFAVQMGDAKSLIRNNDISDTLSLKFNLNGHVEMHQRLTRIQEEFDTTIWEVLRSYYILVREANHPPDTLNDVRELVQELNRSGGGKAYRPKILNAIKKTRGLLPNSNDDIDPDQMVMLQRYSRRTRSLVLREDLKSSDDYEWCSRLVDAISSLVDQNLSIEFSFMYSDKRNDLALTRISVSAQSSTPLMVINFEMGANRSEREKYGVSSVLMPIIQSDDLIKYRSLINRIFDLDSGNSLFEILSNRSFVSNDPLFPELVSRFLGVIFEEFRSCFAEGTYNYVGPLREYPQKYYMRGLGHRNRSSLSNYEIADILDDDPTLLEKTNFWLDGFATSIKIVGDHDEIRRIRAIRNKDQSIDLDISNIGFGVSQVFPVIVQSLLAATDSVTIIEQPEVHLHPKMQARLVDMFADCVYDDKHLPQKSFIIETHSLNFLNRLRLRLAQKKIREEDVVVYTFSVDENNAGAIEEVSLLESFELPPDFIEEELNDTIEFAKLFQPRWES